MARGWLTHLRESAIWKPDGLDDDQLRWAPTTTANSCGQIVVHLGYVERLWFRAIVAGEAMDMGWRPTCSAPRGGRWTTSGLLPGGDRRRRRCARRRPSFDLPSAGIAADHHLRGGRWCT